jgi:hypothetical protein
MGEALVEDAQSFWRFFTKYYPMKWDSFHTEFMRYFASSYKRKLKEEFEQRYQGEFESLNNFVRDIEDYFSRASPSTPQIERVEFIKSKALPEYMPYLNAKSIQSMKELSEYALGLDDIIERGRRPRKPLPPHLCVEPSLAYDPNKYKSPKQREEKYTHYEDQEREQHPRTSREVTARYYTTSEEESEDKEPNPRVREEKRVKIVAPQDCGDESRQHRGKFP